MPNFPSDNKLGRCNKHTWTQPRSGSGTEEGFTTFMWDKGSESDQQRGQGGFLSRDIFCFVFPHRPYRECCILGIPHYHQKKLLRKKKSYVNLQAMTYLHPSKRGGGSFSRHVDHVVQSRQIQEGTTAQCMFLNLSQELLLCSTSILACSLCDIYLAVYSLLNLLAYEVKAY
jgi:hypothetical protein